MKALNFFLITAAALAMTSMYAQAEGISVNDALPTKVLACGGSVITGIGGRLEDDPDFSSGTTAIYKNQGMSVSYEKIDAIIHSRVGDHVLVCLVFIPKNCPAGDERGKEYTVTNLRTLESWTLPDAEHGCGGA